MSCRRIGQTVGCGKAVVVDCLRHATAVGLVRWEVVEALD